MTDVWDRVADRQQVIAVVEAAIAAANEGDPLFGVTVSYGLPKVVDVAPADLFIVGEVRGAASTAVFGPGRTWNDDYTLETGVKVNRKGVDMEAADVRCMDILRAIASLLFVAPRLDRGDNPRPDISLHPSRVEGPNASSLDNASTVSIALLDIECSVAVRGT